jgi:hypothetical protein
MTYPGQQGRPEPPLAGDETATLLGSLERERAILAWKCGGLDAAGLRARLAPSSMTLGGLLKHLALVEDEYFSRRLLGRDLGAPWDTVDWDADPDWEWNSAERDSPKQIYALWHDAVARSRSAVAQALADGGLDRLAMGITDSRDESPSLRVVAREQGQVLVVLVRLGRGSLATRYAEAFGPAAQWSLVGAPHGPLRGRAREVMN